MKKVIKKYHLHDDTQEEDSRAYWDQQNIKYKLEILESLRRDALKMGLYPDTNEKEPRFRRVCRVTSQV